MTDLNPEICRKLREARRAAKLSQVEVAKEIGCKQSALSMFEQGDGTKLNDEAIGKLARKFGVDLAAASSGGAGGRASGDVVRVSEKGVGYCPNPHCPSNHAYDVEGKTCYLPNRAAADPVGGRFCAMCGEVLVKKCPNCGAALHDGGFCSICGEQYVVA